MKPDNRRWGSRHNPSGARFYIRGVEFRCQHCHCVCNHVFDDLTGEKHEATCPYHVPVQLRLFK